MAAGAGAAGGAGPGGGPGGAAARRARFERDGYLALPGFSAPGAVAALRRRAGELVAGFEPGPSHEVFSTGPAQQKAAGGYFLESASRVSFFLEEGAVGPSGELLRGKGQSVNKIGHALHDLDPAFRAFSRSAAVAGLLAELGFERPVPVQSMYIFKQPKIGGRVVPHQDSTFLWTDPPSVVGLWWALEDAHRGNGCLWALPGSHREPVARRMVRDEAGQGGVSFRGEDPPWDLEAAVPLEVEAGTLVVLHGQLVHFSHQNTSPASRHAYTMHVVEGGAGTTWSPENWLQRPADLPLEPLLRPAG